MQQRYWETRSTTASAVTKAKTQVWDKAGEAMERDFLLA